MSSGLNVLNLSGLEANACDGTEANECFCALCYMSSSSTLLTSKREQCLAVEPENGERRWVQVWETSDEDEDNLGPHRYQNPRASASARRFRDLRQPQHSDSSGACPCHHRPSSIEMSRFVRASKYRSVPHKVGHRNDCEADGVFATSLLRYCATVLLCLPLAVVNDRPILAEFVLRLRPFSNTISIMTENDTTIIIIPLPKHRAAD